MSKFEECIDTYKAEFEKLNVSYDEDLLRAVAKGCGPAIYNPDANKVATSDEAETERVKTNYLVSKLGLTTSDDLDGGMDAVIAKFGSSNRNKYRAMFYYLLCVHFKKQSVYSA